MSAGSSGFRTLALALIASIDVRLSQLEVALAAAHRLKDLKRDAEAARTAAVAIREAAQAAREAAQAASAVRPVQGDGTQGGAHRGGRDAELRAQGRQL
mgnify:CR=1 FL=1